MEIKKNDEIASLILKEEKKEKLDLLKIFQRLEEDLQSEEFETLNNIYSQYINSEDITKRNIKPNTKKCSLLFMLYLILPAFGIINLIAIFEGIAIMNSIFQVFKNSFVVYFKSLNKDNIDITPFSLEDFNNNYNFYNIFFESTKKELFDFNLMMFTGFIGDLLFRSRGFIVSTCAFGVVNAISIFLIISFSFYDYYSKDNTYPIFRILYLFLCWLILLIGVGASALFSQQIIIDINTKYNEYIIELKEKQKENEYKEDNKKEELEVIKEEKENEDNENKDDKKEEGKDEKEKEKDENNLIFQNIKSNIKESTKNYGKSLTFDLSKQKGNNLGKKKKKEKKENKEKRDKNKFDSFFMICITTIIGYFLKYFFNIILAEKNEQNLVDYMILAGCANDSICYHNILTNNNLTNNNSALFENLKKHFHEDGYSSFLFIIIIYVSCLVMSIIIYIIFVCIFTENKKENNEEGNKYRVCKLFGYTIYSENIILNKKAPCCECCNLLCRTTKNCLCMICKGIRQDLCNVCGICECLKVFCGCDKCCSCCNCCSNCGEYDVKDYKKNQEFFCYCYQAKSSQSWLNKFITSDIQKKIFPYMLEYFILQILTIAFEKQYLNFENKNEEFYPPINSSNAANISSFNNFFNNNDSSIENKNQILKLENFYTFFTFLITFFLYFYFTLSLNTINKIFVFNELDEKKDDEDKNLEKNEDKRKRMFGVNKISNGILDGVHGILIFNGLYTLIFSPLYLSDAENEIFSNINFFLAPFLMNKFYYFTLIYYCISYSEKKKQFDLISGSTLISLYLFIWKTIVSLIIDSIDLKGLYITQIIIGVFPGIIILYFSFILLVNVFVFISPEPCGERFSLICCILSFIFCFGGFWCNDDLYTKIGNHVSLICGCDPDCEFKCECILCEAFSSSINCCVEWYDENCLNFCCYYCSCCVCCICYDCFGCCECFACCDSTWECHCEDCYTCCDYCEL